MTQKNSLSVDEMKQWIDNATIEDLLFRWRFGEIGSEWFVGEVGEYYAEIMARKRNEDNDAYVRASKHIGWE